MHNRYSFIGNLGRDAEVRTLDGGSSVISFNVAVTETWKDRDGNKQERTEWVNCSLWKQPGQSTAVAQYLRKGQKVYVEGKPSARAYATREGNPAASLEVKVDNLELLGGEKAAGTYQPQEPYGQAPAQQQAAPRQAAPQYAAPQYAPAPQAAAPGTDDDLPF